MKDSSPLPVGKEHIAHETELVPLSYAHVDKQAVRIVQWISKYRGVRTLFSCEGNSFDATKSTHEDLDAYVSFVSEIVPSSSG